MFTSKLLLQTVLIPLEQVQGQAEQAYICGGLGAILFAFI